MAIICHVLEHPSPDTLATIRHFETSSEPVLPLGWIRRTPEQQSAWERAEISGGWTPESLPLSAEELAQQVEAAADASAAEQARQLYVAIQNNTATAAQQRAVLAFLLKCEAKRRGLVPS